MRATLGEQITLSLAGLIIGSCAGIGLIQATDPEPTTPPSWSTDRSDLRSMAAEELKRQYGCWDHGAPSNTIPGHVIYRSRETGRIEVGGPRVVGRTLAAMESGARIDEVPIAGGYCP